MQGIERIRLFNRTVTQYVGALETGFLGRDRPLGECRVLFEIGSNGIEVRELRERLGLDSGYLSRIIRSLERDGLVVSRRSDSDARVRFLAATDAGLEELAALNGASDERAAGLLNKLDAKQRHVLLTAMGDVVKILTASSIQIAPENPNSPAATLCISSYYQELARRFDDGFDPAASISAEPDELTPPNGYLLIARLHGEPVGCGALKCHEAFAEIKRMWVAERVRGLGVGKRILDCLEHTAAELGVELVRLETNGSLKEAQALYRSSGYLEVRRFNDEPYAHHWFEKRIEGTAHRPAKP